MRRNVLITGASSGLGAGMAREFAARGHHLALCARRTDRLDALRAELLGKYPRLAVYVRALDVRDHAQVFDVFRAFDAEIGGLDRVIVNAGMGKGQPLGTGRFDANLQTAETNFVSALAQCEAALELFRKRGHGHLVTISSIAGIRGLPRNAAIYSATKAGLTTLSEALRVELRGTDIKVTTILPGYIDTEINAGRPNRPFVVDCETGSRALVRAIDKEPAVACVPGWPWTPIAWLLRRLPLRVIAKLG